MPKENKSTQAEMLLRIEFVTDLLLNGANYSMIRDMCTKKWNVTSRQVDNYISMCYDQMVEDMQPVRQKNLAKALRQRDKLVLNLMSKRAYKDVLPVLTDIAKLQGLYEQIQKHELTIKGVIGQVDFSKMSDPELAEFIKSAEKALGILGIDLAEAGES